MRLLVHLHHFKQWTVELLVVHVHQEDVVGTLAPCQALQLVVHVHHDDVAGTSAPFLHQFKDCSWCGVSQIVLTPQNV